MHLVYEYMSDPWQREGGGSIDLTFVSLLLT